MTGFLHRLAAKSLGQAPGLQPRRASLFEGAAPLADSPMDVAAPIETPSARAVPTSVESSFAPAQPRMLDAPTWASLPLRPSAPAPSPLPAPRPERHEIHETREILRDASPRSMEPSAPRALPVLKESRVERHTVVARTHTERLVREGAAPALLLPPSAAPKPLPVASPVLAKAAAPRPVQVTIGRVEIRAASTPDRRPKAAGPEPGRNLEDYLRSRRGR